MSTQEDYNSPKSSDSEEALDEAQAHQEEMPKTEAKAVSKTDESLMKKKKMKRTIDSDESDSEVSETEGKCKTKGSAKLIIDDSNIKSMKKKPRVSKVSKSPNNDELEKIKMQNKEKIDAIIDGNERIEEKKEKICEYIIKSMEGIEMHGYASECMGRISEFFNNKQKNITPHFLSSNIHFLMDSVALMKSFTEHINAIGIPYIDTYLQSSSSSNGRANKKKTKLSIKK